MAGCCFYVLVIGQGESIGDNEKSGLRFNLVIMDHAC